MKKLLALLVTCALLISASLAMAEPKASFDITLTENATTGYLWNYTISDEAVLAVTLDEQAAGDTALSGAPGTHSFSITGVAPGEASITFSNYQPWMEDDYWNMFTYFFTVDEGLALTLTDTQGIPEEEMPDWIIFGEYEDDATGLIWSAEVSDESILQTEWDKYFDFAEEFKDEGSPYNVGGFHEWAFHAIGEGDVTVTFTLPGTEADAEPTAVAYYTFTVGPDMIIVPLDVFGNFDYMPETMAVNSILVD